MNSNDFQAQFKNNDRRQHALEQLAEFCSAHNLDYTQSGDKFTVKLPKLKETVMPSNDKRTANRKTFDIRNWGPKGADETALADDFQMPDSGEYLDEGNPPSGDKDDEK